MHELFERRGAAAAPRGARPSCEQAVEANPLHEGVRRPADDGPVPRRPPGRRPARPTSACAAGSARSSGSSPARRSASWRDASCATSCRRATPARADVAERQRRRVTRGVGRAHRAPTTAPVDPEDELALAAPAAPGRPGPHRRARRASSSADAGDGLSACFGYPSTERSVERAVLAALAVRDLADDAAWPCAVGVDTGVVVIEGGRRRQRARAASPASRCGRRPGCATGPAPARCCSAPATAAGVADVVELDRRTATTSSSPWSPAPARRRSRRAPRAGPGRPRGGARRAARRWPSGRRRSSCPVVVSGPAGRRQVGARRAVRRASSAPTPVWLFCDRRHSADAAAPVPPGAARAVRRRRRAVGTRAVLAALRRALGRRRAGARRRGRRRRRPVDAATCSTSCPTTSPAGSSC